MLNLKYVFAYPSHMLTPFFFYFHRVGQREVKNNVLLNSGSVFNNFGASDVWYWQINKERMAETSCCNSGYCWYCASINCSILLVHFRNATYITNIRGIVKG